MKRNISKKLAKRKQKIKKRLKKRNWENQLKPMLSASNIHYDIDGRNKGIANGGIGIIHQLAVKTGLVDEIDDRLELLKRHLPYHESDHVLNIAYNSLAGGHCLQDIELLRNDEAWLDALNDARANLVQIAKGIDPAAWQPLEKEPKYEVKTRTRRRPENVKEQVVIRRKFKNVQTVAEHMAEFAYRSGKCKQDYRMIVLRKTIKVTQGELKLFDDIRYFFYITNDMSMSAKALIEFYRERADHENDIEQLKNGVRALQAPSDNLLSNWAYMVIASLAWDLKAWYGMLFPYRHSGLQIMRMEFKRFINTFIRIPCLIVKAGRRIYYRLIGYNDQLKHTLNFAHMLKSFSFQ